MKRRNIILILLLIVISIFLVQYWSKQEQVEKERLEHEIVFENYQKKTITLFLVGETIIYDFGNKKEKVKKNKKKEEEISKKEIEMIEKKEKEGRDLIKQSGIIVPDLGGQPLNDGSLEIRLNLWKNEVFEKKYPEKIQFYDRF